MDNGKAPTGTGTVDETGEPWVTGTPPVAQRVPGINEAQEATYVAPEGNDWRRPVLIGVAVGLVVTAIFAAFVVANDSGGSPAGETKIAAGITASSTTTTLGSTSTTVAPVTQSTTAPPTGSGAATPTTTVPAPAPAPAVTPATPRATSDPAAPTYTQVPLPLGVSATLTTCAWQPTNGGQYEGAGTVSNRPTTNHWWKLTIHWLQNNREIGSQSAVVPVNAGQTVPWNLTLAAPNPPAEPFSCALTATAS